MTLKCAMDTVCMVLLYSWNTVYGIVIYRGHSVLCSTVIFRGDSVCSSKTDSKLEVIQFGKKIAWGDLITMYSHMNGQYRYLSCDLFVPGPVTMTMGHPLRLKERRFHYHCQGFFKILWWLIHWTGERRSYIPVLKIYYSKLWILSSGDGMLLKGFNLILIFRDRKEFLL